MRISWFIARRDDAGRIVKVETGLNEADAQMLADTYAKSDPSPPVKMGGFDLHGREIPRWCAHWRVVR